MSDPDAVKRALARLATRPTGAGTRTATRLSRDRSFEYRPVIDRATAAVEELADAAEFAETVGIERLEAAIEAAETAGDHAAARRGRRARGTFERVRSAADG
ncbi:MAG: hypothetical protein ABEI77_01480 [Halorientalis sp.]